MVNQSFRAAFWALIVAFALSVSALCSDPEEVRIALLAPSARPVPGIDDGSHVRLLAESEPHAPVAPAIETWDGDRLAASVRIEPLVSTPRDTGSEPPLQTAAEHESQPWTDPFPVLGPLVQEASAPVSSELPWLVTSATPASRNSRFEELQPPPEFQEFESGEQPAPAAAAQIEELISTIEGLRGDMEALRSTQESVQQTLGTLSAATEAAPPQEVLLQVWVFDVPHSEGFQGGFVTALEGSRELSTIRGAAGDSSVSFLWSETEGTEFWRWLQRQEPVRELAARTMQLPQQAVAEVMVPGPARPRIEQARGTDVSPPDRRGETDVRFELRASSPSPTVIDVEFRPSSARGEEWLRASVPAGAVLVIEAPAGASRSAAGALRQLRTQSMSRSTVVVVQPSVTRSPIEPPSLPELNPLLIP